MKGHLDKFSLTAVAQKTKSTKVNEALKRNPRNNPVTLGRKGKMSPGSRYGTALINLGKMQDDDLEAFAVGAPFEDEGKGAVYIYFGSKNFWRGDTSGEGTKFQDKYKKY